MHTKSESSSSICSFGTSLLLIAIFLAFVGYNLNWFSDKEITVSPGPKAELMMKYSWFKTTADLLRKQQAEIKAYESKIRTMARDYAELSRNQWPRDDQDKYNSWVERAAGLKAEYNSLATEYNSRQTSLGLGPADENEEEPLPRHFQLSEQ